MSEQLAGYPYTEVRFDKAARLVDDGDRTALQQMVRQSAVTDLLLLSHGWNNDMDDARAMYRQMADSLRAVQDGEDSALLAGRTIALVGVLWPSKKFADVDLIPGGAASFGSDPAERLERRIDDLSDAFDAQDGSARLAEARGLTSQLEDSPAARRRFVELVRGAVPGDVGEDEDASGIFLEMDPEQLFANLDDPSLDDPTWLPPAPAVGGGAAVLDAGGGAVFDGGASAFDGGGVGEPGAAAGSGAGFGLGGMVRAAERLLNYATYYQMKARAGLVGERGLAPLLHEIATPGVRIHLVGHSFGGRLVSSAAAAATESGAAHVDSLVLLQAAFSQFGFAQNWEPHTDGAFRGLLTDGRLAGPLVITHTRNDKAVSIAYAIASRIANQAGAELGGPTSRFGGMGANGAQRTPEAEQQTLLPISGRYAFARGRAYNLRADAFVADHGDVTGREVAHAILSSVGGA
jgi:predicted alpha/beta hydrolase family esterase